MDALGVGADAGQAAALLARSVLAPGRVDEADRYAAESERLARPQPEDRHRVAGGTGRDQLAAQGRHDEAVVMANEAGLPSPAGTDLVLDHAEACLALGRVFAAAGDEPGASLPERDAADVEWRKGSGQLPLGRRSVRPGRHRRQPIAGTAVSRLAITNRASKSRRRPRGSRCGPTTSITHVDGYADEFVYDERR